MNWAKVSVNGSLLASCNKVISPRITTTADNILLISLATGDWVFGLCFALVFFCRCVIGTCVARQPVKTGSVARGFYAATGLFFQRRS